MTSPVFPAIDLQTWLEAMALQPLPGGVAAAAVAAAMGAALIVKAGRVTLRRQTLDNAGRAFLRETVDQADAMRLEFVRLADEDAGAYRAFLMQKGTPGAGREQAAREAWQAATELPLQVAEASQSVLGRLEALQGSCWSSVCADFEIARWLLDTGLQAGLLAVESNLPAGREWAGGREIQARYEEMRHAYTNGD